ncbi:4-azaleucine resistance probable transporter AzlC [Marinobacter persicus]|uniref:4-azaleucine resistance probable transporter AzlC n=1 Tax=Marinobacter persicus TaxID=930118 RepID=A0A1I3WD89_9GAMM|nr:AzlC family ABC transporter permease [Marinobacter persicus]GHD47364.1 branched-chain amino acid ABC transporter permease [Marinobacter persicus]SFK05422.1 4-azaleucine resistance probable transporter AzlC [Marinobacter persicus]
MNQTVFKLTLPILFGYLPLGTAFGVLFATQLDYAWWIAPLMGLVIYAGAGQILAVSLLAANAGLLEVAVAMFVLNARHLFYGLSLLGQFQGAGWRKAYLIFGLTDETYSLLTSRPRTGNKANEQQLDFRITAFNQLYWVVGCALGGLLGEMVAFNSTGIEFALVALFIVLTIEQFKALGDSFPIWSGALAAGLAMLLVPPAHQLIAGIAIVTLVLLLHYRHHRNALIKTEASHD